MNPRTALLIGLLALALPSAAAAQSPSCAVLAGVQPVSTHYVSMVLARVDDGMEYAAHLNEDDEDSGEDDAAYIDDFGQYLPSWSRVVNSGLLAMVDSRLRIIEQQKDLPDRTACLHIDHALLQCKAMEVTAQIHEAIRAGAWKRIWILTSILPFLQERETQLLRGALSPRYHDHTWGIRQPFDPEESPYGTYDITARYVCGDEIVSPGEECDDGNTDAGDGCSDECRSEICPFTSDYAEDSFMGGCSAAVLAAGNRLGFPSAAAEYASLLFLEQSYAGFRQNAASLVALQQQIATLGPPGRAPVLPAPLPEPQRVAGCVPGRGVCTNLPGLACIEDNDCLGVLGGTCSITTLQNVAFWPPRHSLSVEKDHLRVLAAFQELRGRQGAARRFRTDLLLEGERNEDGERITDRQLTISEIAFIPERRAYYASVAAKQGMAEAALYATAADPQLMMAEALKGLRGSVASMAELASNRTGLRGLLVRFGYFLLRTCADRPCNMQLQQIIKMALTDECFPYTNGAYLQHSCDSPSWQVCADAVREMDGSGVPFATNLPFPQCP